MENEPPKGILGADISGLTGFCAACGTSAPRGRQRADIWDKGIRERASAGPNLTDYIFRNRKQIPPVSVLRESWQAFWFECRHGGFRTDRALWVLCRAAGSLRLTRRAALLSCIEIREECGSCERRGSMMLMRGWILAP